MSLINNLRIVGHVCHDRTTDGYILGGTASYAALLGAQLSDKIILTTSYGQDFGFAEIFDKANLSVELKESDKTTEFENIYTEHSRKQYLHGRADNLYFSDLGDVLDTQAILLGPIADEVDLSSFDALDDHILIGAAIQGWLRQFRPDGLVYQKPPDLSSFKCIDIAFMSDDDILGMPLLLEQLKDSIEYVVVTHGINGVSIHHNNLIEHYPSYQTHPVDPTGAGDIFSIAFLCAFYKTGNLTYAASFGHSAASLSIEGLGISTIPSLNQIQERQEEYSKRYL